MGNCFGFYSKDANPSSTISANNPPTPWSSANNYSTTTMDFSATTSSRAGKSQFSAAASDAANEEGSSSNGEILEAPDLREFSFADLKNATDNFKLDTLLGEGRFGKVYKGWVDERTFAPSNSGVGIVVAVKKLKSQSMQFLQEWQSKIKSLWRVSHPNLVKLFGYCLEDKEMLLVYEFMEKGSLENHLFTKNAGIEPLSWELRLKIAIGAARGLAFLHASEKKVICRDFKASNILLDGNYNAKISDFGLAELGSLGGEGTYGYAAPDYIAAGNLYVKNDVYGFGVVLIELLTGLRSIDTRRTNSQQNLVDWVKPILSNKKELKNVMDIKIEGQYSSKGMMLAAQLSSKCIELDPKSRPSMKEVVEALEQIDAINEKPKGSKKFCFLKFNEVSPKPEKVKENKSRFSSNIAM